MRIGGEEAGVGSEPTKGRAYFSHLTLELCLLYSEEVRPALCAAPNSRGAGSEIARFTLLRARAAACSAPALVPRPRAPPRCCTARTHRFIATRAPQRELQPRSHAAALPALSASCRFASASQPAPSAGPRCSTPAPLLPRPRGPCAGTPGGNPPDPRLARHDTSPGTRASSPQALVRSPRAAGVRDGRGPPRRSASYLAEGQACSCPPSSAPQQPAPRRLLARIGRLAERLRGRAGHHGRRRRSGATALAAADARPRRRSAAAE